MDFNNKLRLTLEVQQCRLTPTFEEEREGAIERERWPARNKHGTWKSAELERYLQGGCYEPADREQRSEGRQVENRYRHRDHYPELRLTEDKLRRELQEKKKRYQKIYGRK